MKEIEDIVEDWFNNNCDNLAKAIEQYVIKARIEELCLLEKNRQMAIRHLIDGKGGKATIDQIIDRIAELKKGLE